MSLRRFFLTRTRVTLPTSAKDKAGGANVSDRAANAAKGLARLHNELVMNAALMALRGDGPAGSDTERALRAEHAAGILARAVRP